jgi:hypothetical protein
MMVAPDKEYFLIVCQCPNEETEHAWSLISYSEFLVFNFPHV